MGWQKVGNQRYYYERKRVDGEIVSRYIGCGPEAEAKARADAVEMAAQREEDRRDREVVRKWMERDREIDALTNWLDAFIKSSLETQLAKSGYHRVNGTWRKARKKKANPERERLMALKKEILEHGPRLRRGIEPEESFSFLTHDSQVSLL